MLFSNDSLYILGFDSIPNAFIGPGGGGFCQLNTTEDGSKIVTSFSNNDTTDVCVYNFDRCTGFISFDKRIFFSDANLNQLDLFWLIRRTTFSNDGKFVYAMTWDTLYQLNSTLDWTQQTPLVIWYDTNHVDFNDIVAMVDMERAPDGKIYVSRDRASNNSSTFPDSINRYLGVIDSIDNAYPSAHFIRKGFYLGGRQARGGLVQNVNYDLGPWVGSPCDTLTTTSLSEQSTKPKITLAPNPAQTEAALTWSGVAEGAFVLRDMLGRAVLSEVLNTPIGTTRLDLSALPKGIYLWQVQSAGYSKNGKLVVE